MIAPSTDYWNLTDQALASAWRMVDEWNRQTDYCGDAYEALNLVEDAVLQRIGAPDTASGDEPQWQAKIRAFGATT